MEPMHWQTAYRELRADRGTSFDVKAALARSLDLDPWQAVEELNTVLGVMLARLDETQGGDGFVRSTPAIDSGR